MALLFRKEFEEAADPEAARPNCGGISPPYLTPYPAADGGFIDEVIDPRETRPASSPP